MNIRKWTGVTFTALFLLVLLTKYQNCAPAPHTMDEAPTDSTARVVDDWSQSKVAFIEQQIEVHDQAQDVLIDGLCARSDHGQPLYWSLHDPQGRLAVLQGQSECERGGFRLQLSDVQNMVCGQNYVLNAQSADGESDGVLISRKCAPLRVEEIADSTDGSPYEEVCYLELEPDAQALANTCNQVCYRRGKVATRAQLPLNECEGLQASMGL